MRIAAAFLLTELAALHAETRLLVSVTGQKTAGVVSGLAASDFTITDGGSARRVLAAKFQTLPVDCMLLVDSSAPGQQVQKMAADLIGQMRDKEQMALATFDSSAELAQDFTSSQPTLLRALGAVRYGNSPHVLDGLFAAIDGGFEHAVLRKVVLLVTTGVEGRSRVSEREVIRVAARNGVSIYPLYLARYERGMFETLARNTGGVPMSIGELSRSAKNPALQVFDAIRSHYELTISGNLAPTEKMKIEVNRPDKVFVSWLVRD